MNLLEKAQNGYYKNYNVLIRKMETAENKLKQAVKNYRSIYYKRLGGLLKIKYDESLQCNYGINPNRFNK